MQTANSTHEREPKIFRTLRNDVQRGDFKRTVKREWLELKELLLDEQGKERLTEMSAFRRWFVTMWWLFKSLFFKLTPARRLLLVIGLFLIIGSRTVTFSSDSFRVTSDTNGVGVLLVLFVLGLELKDKLVAKKELETGRALQAALMCEPSPRVAGWDLWLFTRSANEVGGDLVDFMNIDKRRFGVVLADVSGKGLTAALLAARLQATLKAIMSDFSKLSELGTKLNSVFCRDCIPSLFASLILVEGEEESNSLRILNAGHIPPLVVRGGRVTQTGKGGPALGLMAQGAFPEHVVLLQRDDLLVIYSDGVTEAQNTLGEFFGEQRLQDLLPQLARMSAKQIGERIVSEVDRFVGEANVHDDLSIAILRRT